MFLLTVILVEERVRGKIGLARYKRELVAKGEQISPSDFAASPRVKENAAPEVYAAVQRLKEGAVLPKRYPPAMRLTPAGRAIVGFRESQWVEDGAATSSFAAVRSDIDRYESELLDRSLYDRLRYPNSQSPISLSKAVNKAMRAETERSIVICTIALKRYGISHGKPAASLDSLVPAFLASVRLIAWTASR